MWRICTATSLALSGVPACLVLQSVLLQSRWEERVCFRPCRSP